MASAIQDVEFAGFAGYLPQTAEDRLQSYEAVYEHNRRRVYSLAFWMTDNEPAAEQLMGDTFRRAFDRSSSPSPEAVDQALIAELRESMALGALSLACRPSPDVLGVRRNTLRVHLERAVVQLPATERLIFLLHDVEGYDHARVVRTLGIGEHESVQGLHQARLRMRELLSSMI